MTKSRGNSAQQFDLLEDAEFRRALSAAIKLSKKSREVIAEEMGIPLSLLNTYTSSSTQQRTSKKGEILQPKRRFPGYLLKRFCKAAGNQHAIHCIAGRTSPRELALLKTLRRLMRELQ